MSHNSQQRFTGSCSDMAPEKDMRFERAAKLFPKQMHQKALESF